MPRKQPWPEIAQAVEAHAGREKAEQPQRAAKAVVDQVDLQAEDPGREQYQRDRQGQQPAHPQTEQHQIKQCLAGQAPERAVDDAADIARPEHGPGQPVVMDVEHRIVQQEQPGLGFRQVFTHRQIRHERPDREHANDEAPEQPGENPQGALREEDKGRRRCVEALRDQVAADREKHEDAGETENRLAAGQDHQRVVVLRILGQQKGMREDDREGRQQAEQVEIVVPLQAPLSVMTLETTGETGLAFAAAWPSLNRHALRRLRCVAESDNTERSCDGGRVRCGCGCLLCSAC